MCGKFLLLLSEQVNSPLSKRNIKVLYADVIATILPWLVPSIFFLTAGLTGWRLLQDTGGNPIIGVQETVCESVTGWILKLVCQCRIFYLFYANAWHSTLFHIVSSSRSEVPLRVAVFFLPLMSLHQQQHHYTFTCTGTLWGKQWTARMSVSRRSALFRTLQFCPFCTVYKHSTNWIDVPTLIKWRRMEFVAKLERV